MPSVVTELDDAVEELRRALTPHQLALVLRVIALLCDKERETCR